jgi:hypothetical protein
MSQGWSRALLDVSVAYGTDVLHAQQVIKEVADEVWQDETYGPLVLDEPEVWGVEMLGADGIAIRLVVKTAPLEQWKVARELRRRLKEAFDEEGIEIPFPQRALWLRTSPDGAPSPVTEAGGAAGSPGAEQPESAGAPGATGASGSAGTPGAATPGAAGARQEHGREAPAEDRNTVRRAMRRPSLPPAGGEADVARTDTGALPRPDSLPGAGPPTARQAGAAGRPDAGRPDGGRPDAGGPVTGRGARGGPDTAAPDEGDPDAGGGRHGADPPAGGRDAEPADPSTGGRRTSPPVSGEAEIARSDATAALRRPQT